MRRKLFIRNGGFTLLELSIVILIIAVITGMGVVASKTVKESAKQTATDNKLDVIEKALMAFRRANNRLPCPADATLLATATTFGMESVNPGACTTGSTYDGDGVRTVAANPGPTVNFASFSAGKGVEGTVPVATLGLPTEFMYDGWGRKFVYGVPPVFTAYDAFSLIPSKTTCLPSEALWVSDVSDPNIAAATRSSSTAYVVMSYGPNGNGAYLESGTRMYSNNLNVAENMNCHCYSDNFYFTYDGNYVQQDVAQNAADSNDVFDDIVRFKERWQLATPEDGMNDDGYRGPTLAIGFAGSGTPGVYTYKPTCGNWVKQANLSPMPNNDPVALTFTSRNQHLLVHSGLGCNLYKITGSSTVTNLPGAVPSCPAYTSSNRMALSNNGYLAITTGGGTIQLWKQSGDAFVALTSITSATTTSLSFSRNADFLVLSTGVVYRRKGNLFVSLGAIGSPLGTPTSYAFSSDGLYLGSTNDTQIKLWRMPTTTVPVIGDFTALSALTPGGTGLSRITFSPDGRYFAVGQTDSPFVHIYKINPGDSFVLATIDATGLSVGDPAMAISFTADSNYVAVSTDRRQMPVAMFRRTGVTAFTFVSTNTFRYNDSPTDTDLHGSDGYSVTFSQ